MHWRILFTLFVASLRVSAQTEASTFVGQTEQEIIAVKGAPQSKAIAGNRAIYRWSDMEITFKDGVATSSVRRDLVQEERSRIDASKARAAMQARENAIKMAQSKPVVVLGPLRDFPQTPSPASRALAERSKQREEVSRRAQEEVDFARRQALILETNRLRTETRQAYIDGDRRRSGALAQELKAKERERKALDELSTKHR